MRKACLHLMLLFLCSFLSIKSSHIVPPYIHKSIIDLAKQFAQDYKDLPPQELELLANFLYLSKQHAYFDAQTGLTMTKLYHTLPDMRLAIHSELDPIESSKAFMKASKQFMAYNGLRYYYYLLWKKCLAQIEQTNSTELAQACKHMQTAGQEIIIDFIASNAAFYTNLPSLHSQLKQSNHQINIGAHAIEKLFQKMSGTTASRELLIDTDRTLQIANQQHDAIHKIEQSLAHLDQFQNNLLEVGSIIFQEHYKAIYPHLRSEHSALLFEGANHIDGQKQLPEPEKNIS